jgi:thiosulfate reductase cytochrome b subunit
MSEILYLYPLWVRLWHWINALMFLVLIVTGISMQYSSPDLPMIRFDRAVYFHNLSGVILTISFVFFVVLNRITSNSRYYKYKKKGFLKRLKRQFAYYTVGIFRQQEPPYPVSRKRKFNPMQKLSYLLVMYVLMPVMIVTGLALMYPEIIIENVYGISGIHLTDLLHIISGFVLSLFMVVHIYFCTIGKTPVSNFRSMITGWHEAH